MEKNVKKKLLGVLDTKIDDLSSMEPGTEEHTRTTNDVGKLYQLIQEDEKQEWDLEREDIHYNQKDKDYEREIEKEKRETRRNWIQFGITTTVGILTTVGSYIFFKKRYHEGLQFEKDGTYTARGGAQKILNMIKPVNKTH